MKVVYLNPIGQMGGAEAALLEVMTAIRQSKPEWTLHLVVGHDGPLPAKAKELGVHPHILEFPASLATLGDSSARDNFNRLTLIRRLFLASFGAALYARRLRKKIRQLAPDIIHTNGFKMHVLGAIVRPKGTQLFWHIHDYLQSRPLMASLMKRLSGRCNVALANSQSVARDIRSLCGEGLRVQTLYNAIDTEVFRPEGETLELDSLAKLPPAHGETIRVGMLATFARWKGQEVFLRALAKLPSNLPVRGFIIGGALYKTEGSQYSLTELKSLAVELSISDRIGFIDFVDQPAAAMRALDIVVHASTQPEPFGLVIAEGMACGRATIASAAGGALEIFEPGIDALAHKPGDFMELASQITTLAKDGDLRKRLGAAGRSTIKGRFNRTRLANELIAVYSNISITQAESVGILAPQN